MNFHTISLLSDLNQFHNILLYHFVIDSGKTLLMKEKAIHLATAGENVIFIYDSLFPAKTLLHYNLENYFTNALQDCSGSILVFNATWFVSYFIFISNHHENTEYSHMALPLPFPSLFLFLRVCPLQSVPYQAGPLKSYFDRKSIHGNMNKTPFRVGVSPL